MKERKKESPTLVTKRVLRGRSPRRHHRNHTTAQQAKGKLHGKCGVQHLGVAGKLVCCAHHKGGLLERPATAESTGQALTERCLALRLPQLGFYPCPLLERGPDLGPPGQRGYLPRHTNAVEHAPSYHAGWGRALTAARPLGADLDWPPEMAGSAQPAAAEAAAGPPGHGDPLTTLCGRWGAAAGHSAKDGPFEHDERRSAAKRPKWDQLLC